MELQALHPAFQPKIASEYPYTFLAGAHLLVLYDTRLLLLLLLILKCAHQKGTWFCITSSFKWLSGVFILVWLWDLSSTYS